MEVVSIILGTVSVHAKIIGKDSGVLKNSYLSSSDHCMPTARRDDCGSADECQTSTYEG